MKKNLIDRVIETVLPSSGRRRMADRLAMEAMEQAQTMAYDGATRGHRAGSWRATGTDVNAEISRGGARLRNVARDMVRNNPHASRAVQVISEGTIGAGITPNFEGADEKTLNILTDFKRRHLETTAIDAAGRLDIYGIENLVMRTLVESGEVLIRRRLRSRADGLPLPFQIEVLEPDFLDSGRDGDLPNGNIILQGVEFDAKGCRVAYWLFPQHPGGLSHYSKRFESYRVPASEVAHVYRVDRAGQVRGITWFAPVIIRMRDFAEFADAQLVRQKIAACFSVFIRKPNDAGGPFSKSAADTSPAGNPVEAVEPGMIERLRDGEEVTFGTPPGLDGYSDYTVTTMHEVAVGLGIDYASLTGDNRQANFASSRMGWLRFHRSIESWQWGTIIPQACAPIGKWFIEAAAIEMAVYIPDVRAKWTPPRREMFDPNKDVIAAREAIKAGLSSRSAEVRKLGYDPEEMDAENVADNQRADKDGLTYSSDPRAGLQNKKSKEPAK